MIHIDSYLGREEFLAENSQCMEYEAGVWLEWNK